MPDKQVTDSHAADEARAAKVAAVERAAAARGFCAPTKAVNFLDLHLITLDAQGRAWGIHEALDDVAARHPELFRPVRPSPGTPPPRSDLPLDHRVRSSPDPFEQAMRGMTYERM